METSATYTGGEMFVSSDERKFINRIRQFAREYPDDVTIIAQPENNDGCIYARMPAKWFSIKPPTKRNFTEEQRAALSERAKMMQVARKGGSATNES